MISIAIVNGPNLNLIGTREPSIYGNVSLDEFLKALKEKYKDVVTLHTFLSNIEGELINFLHTCSGKMEGIILNAGAYTHTSIAIADAVAAIGIPTVEVHISNVMAREEYRKTSFIASKCVGSISGLGLYGYEAALCFYLENNIK